jgi:hypothetical protein
MNDIYSLGELSDRQAITDLYARYVHATDDQDYDELDRIFLPESVFDWTSVGHVKADWAGYVRDEYIRNGQFFIADFHLAAGIRINFNADRSEAQVKSKMLNATAVRNEQGVIVANQVHGGYSDSLVRKPDGWRIVSRVWNHKFITIEHATAGGSAGMLESDRA